MRTLEHEIVYRGEAAVNKLGAAPIIVCGAGAIGSNLVDNLVRQGFKSITIIDDDRIEDHNRHTQVWQRRDVGSLKVAALKSHAFNSMGVSIEDKKVRLTSESVEGLLKKGSLVVDGFDNHASRKSVTDYCKANNIECLHIGLYQNYAEVIWNDNYLVPEDAKAADVCEYPLARNVILLAIAVSTEVIIRYILDGNKEQYTITLKDFCISPKEE